MMLQWHVVIKWWCPTSQFRDQPSCANQTRMYEHTLHDMSITCCMCCVRMNMYKNQIRCTHQFGDSDTNAEERETCMPERMHWHEHSWCGCNDWKLWWTTLVRFASRLNPLSGPIYWPGKCDTWCGHALCVTAPFAPLSVSISRPVFRTKFPVPGCGTFLFSCNLSEPSLGVTTCRICWPQSGHLFESHVGRCYMAALTWSVAAMRVNKNEFATFWSMFPTAWCHVDGVQCQHMVYWALWTVVELIFRIQRVQYNCNHCLWSYVSSLTAWPCC